MNGLNSIRNINHHRTHDAVIALEKKAVLAKQQNHPQAEALAAQAEALRAELEVEKSVH
jgi:hypothetical protein